MNQMLSRPSKGSMDEMMKSGNPHQPEWATKFVNRKGDSPKYPYHGDMGLEESAKLYHSPPEKKKSSKRQGLAMGGQGKKRLNQY